MLGPIDYTHLTSYNNVLIQPINILDWHYITHLSIAPIYPLQTHLRISGNWYDNVTCGVCWGRSQEGHGRAMNIGFGQDNVPLGVD